MNEGKDKKNKDRNDMKYILALALIKSLYNQEKISELVYRNIEKDTIDKISLANRKYIC